MYTLFIILYEDIMRFHEHVRVGDREFRQNKKKKNVICLNKKLITQL